MSNWQFSILLVTLFIGIIWQRVDTFQVNLRIDRLGADLTARIDRIADDLRQFYQTLGAHGEAIETLKGKH